MKRKGILTFVIVALFMAVGISGCSSHDYDPEDSVTSVLSGEYGKGQFWSLNLTENGNPLEVNGYVRFDSKLLKEGDFRFVDVIPGESVKEFKDVPLTGEENGMAFRIEFVKDRRNIEITGVVSFGEMSVDMKL